MARDLDEHFGEDLDTSARRQGARANLNALVAMAQKKLAHVDRDDPDAWADAVFSLDIPEDDGGFIAAAAPAWAQKQGARDAGGDSDVEYLRWVVVALAESSGDDEGALGAVDWGDDAPSSFSAEDRARAGRAETAAALRHREERLRKARRDTDAWLRERGERPAWMASPAMEREIAREEAEEDEEDEDEVALGALPLDDEELEDERIDPNEQRDEVVNAMARMMWGLAYASAWEEAYDDGEATQPPWLGGGRVDDYLPETPRVIRDGAQSIIDAAVRRGGVSLQSVLEVLWDDFDSPAAFGHELACIWMGAGCGGSGLSDREIKSKTGGFAVGSGELVVFLVDGDPGTVEVNYFGGTGLK